MFVFPLFICLFWLFLFELQFCSFVRWLLNTGTEKWIKACVCSRSSYLFLENLVLHFSIVENVKRRVHFCFQKGEENDSVMKASLRITRQDEGLWWETLLSCTWILKHKKQRLLFRQFYILWLHCENVCPYTGLCKMRTNQRYQQHLRRSLNSWQPVSIFQTRSSQQ